MRKLLLYTFLLFTTFTSFGQIKSIHPIHSADLVLFKKSLPLRDLPSYSDGPGALRIEKENPSLEKDQPVSVNKNALPLGDDAAVQHSYRTQEDTMLSVISNWAGLSTSVDPSDNTLAVSANYVIQMTNNSSNSLMNIWDKSGNLLVDKVNSGDITGFSDYGDPNIIYDWQADRFIFCTLDGNLANKLVVCISETNDPTGSWFGYKLNFNNGLPDYPKIAVWGNSYFITTNSNEPTIWALNREQLLAGATVSAAEEFNLTRFGTIGFQSASPVTQTGMNIPDANAPAVMIRVADDAWAGVDIDKLELYYVTMDWDNAGASAITGPIELNTIAYDSKLCGFDSWNCIPQPSSTIKLHPLGDIIMDKAQYVRFDDHESIVCSHVCKAYTAGYSGVRWYELRKTADTDWSLYQQGTYAPLDSNYRFMGSVTMNQEGTMALGFNISSDKVYPGIRVTGRRACDSLNIMTAPEEDMMDGTHANSINRYGDYNNMITDPLDGSFWFTANYNPSSSWKTRVMHFKIETCPVIPIDTTSSLFDNLIIQPVPANEEINISLSLPDDASVDFIIYDVNGQTVLNETQSLLKGSNTINFKLDQLASATYFLLIRSGDDEITKKFLVQHGE